LSNAHKFVITGLTKKLPLELTPAGRINYRFLPAADGDDWLDVAEKGKTE
jgi:hypothetical protein